MGFSVVAAVRAAGLYVGVSENRGPKYSTLNRRVLIIYKDPKIRYPEFSESPMLVECGSVFSVSCRLRKGVSSLGFAALQDLWEFARKGGFNNSEKLSTLKPIHPKLSTLNSQPSALIALNSQP